MIAEAAKSYIGTPFKHQGRLPGVGLDCVGVAICAMREAGFDVGDYSTYPMDPDSTQLLDGVRDWGVGVDPSNLEPGNLVVFWWSTKNLPKHVGIYIGDGKIVHSYMRARKTIVDNISRFKIHSAWRVRG